MSALPNRLIAVCGLVVVCAASVLARGSADTRIGVNLPELGAQGGADVVFTDAMKQGAPWVSSLHAPLLEGTDGNVRMLRPGESAQTVIYGNTRYPSGDYTLLYDGTGRFDIDSQSGLVVHRAPGRLVLRIYGMHGGIHLSLRDVAVSNPPRDVRLILPGFEPTYAMQPFHPQFVAKLRQSSFNILRFRNWMHGSTYAAFAPAPLRLTTHQFTQATGAGVAPEYMIALANLTGTDPWFTLPVDATDLYIRNFAQLVRQQLNPALHPMFEYGDQVWKTGTLSNAYAAMAAGNRGPTTNSQSAELTALRWYSLRSVQIFRLIQNAFGPQAGRVVRVLSAPLPLMRPENLEIDRTILSVGGAGRNADVLAIDNDGQTPPLSVFRSAVVQAAILARFYKLSLAASQLSNGPQTIQVWPASGGGMLVTDSIIPTTRPRPGNGQLIAGSLDNADGRKKTLPAVWVRTPTSGALATRGLAPITPAIAVNAGGPPSGSYGADFGFRGGRVLRSTSFGIDTKAVQNPAPQSVYDSARAGNFSYTFSGLKPTVRYLVRLHFAEYQYGAVGGRTFDVSINGRRALSRFDIYKLTGRKNTAIVIPLYATAPSTGSITIAFASVGGPAVVQALEVSVAAPAIGFIAPPHKSKFALQLADANGFTLACSPNPAQDNGSSTCTGSESGYAGAFTATTTDAANPSGPAACGQSIPTNASGTVTYTLFSANDDTCSTSISDGLKTSVPITVTFSSATPSPSPTPTASPSPSPSPTPTPSPSPTPTASPSPSPSPTPQGNPTLVQSVTGTTTATVTSLATKPFATTPAAGTLLLASVSVLNPSGTQSPNVVTAPAGWTKLDTAVSSSSTATYYKSASSGEPTSYAWSFSQPSSRTGIIIENWSGTSPTAPIDQHAIKIVNSSTPTTSTVVPGAVGKQAVAIFSAFYSVSRATSATPQAGWASDNFAPNPGANLVATHQLTVTGTTAIATSITWNTGYYTAAEIFTLNPVSSSPGPTSSPTPVTSASPTPTWTPPGNPAPSLAQTTTGTTTASVTSLNTGAFAHSPAAGTLLLASVSVLNPAGAGSPNTIYAPRGWTPLDTAIGSSSTATFYKVAGPGEQTYYKWGWAQTSSSNAIIVQNWMGTSAIPIDQHAIQIETSASPSTPTIVPTQGSTQSVAIFSAYNPATAATSATPQTGWTLDYLMRNSGANVATTHRAGFTGTTGLSTGIAWNASYETAASIITINPGSSGYFNPNSRTVPFWESSFSYAGQNYTYKMVGTNPAMGGTSTTIGTEVIPLRLVFSDGTILDAGSAAQSIPKSPLFTNALYPAGNTQYGDALMRSEFWKYASNINYHVLLQSPVMEPTVLVNVPATEGHVTLQSNGSKIGYINTAWFLNTMQPQVIAQLGIDPTTLAFFATASTQLREWNGGCCYSGYHTALHVSTPSGPAIFTTVWASVTASSVETMSHEVAEWFDDPFYDNYVPRWVQPINGACEISTSAGGMLEDGDQLTNHTFLVNGFLMQDASFYSWFSRDVPSIGINGQYDLQGVFTKPAASC